MSLRFTILSAIAIGLVLLFTGALIWQGPPKETKDRIPPPAMARMVNGAASAVRERGLAGGDAEFDRLLAIERARSGSNGAGTADLTMAYGVELYDEWMESDDDTLLQASRDRILASIPHYRAAFGSNHPEVALALHSFAEVDFKLNGEASPTAEAALSEALQIRRAALGPTNPETLAAEERLESISGHGNGAISSRVESPDDSQITAKQKPGAVGPMQSNR